MEIIDEQERIARQREHFDRVAELADNVFGKERVAFSGRGFMSSARNDLYVDWNADGSRAVYNIEIHLGEFALFTSIRVYNEKCFEEAKRFAEEYASKFNNKIQLTHNFPK